MDVDSIEVTFSRHLLGRRLEGLLRFKIKDGKLPGSRAVGGESREVALRNKMVFSCDVHDFTVSSRLKRTSTSSHETPVRKQPEKGTITLLPRQVSTYFGGRDQPNDH